MTINGLQFKYSAQKAKLYNMNLLPTLPTFFLLFSTLLPTLRLTFLPSHPEICLSSTGKLEQKRLKGKIKGLNYIKYLFFQNYFLIKLRISNSVETERDVRFFQKQ